MVFIVIIVLLFDLVMVSKILGSMIRADFNPAVYINTKFWVRIGILIIFHVVMAIISGFTFYIGAIVRATL
ncbi:hypothetical protein ST201phi2-1p133 [Pseudomonas phage 201phi2-1]|uniref:Uncharacterized protein n=1 Tax=Pseudomonas phage 201phi2-1 TaxID=198110 RepID=B3FIZ6_BP201|nr:hypothetical protein ST201phi2-1p133 [Pseudomonas phage 201phi2-1]ABY62965.1 hypothetical protein 201phi2-1p133 [Pseudomonas phage 201phi2-1]